MHNDTKRYKLEQTCISHHANICWINGSAAQTSHLNILMGEETDTLPWMTSPWESQLLGSTSELAKEPEGRSKVRLPDGSLKSELTNSIKAMLFAFYQPHQASCN